MKVLCTLIICSLLLSIPAFGLEIIGKQVRNDIYPLDMDSFQWVEGWAEPFQFFPDYFKLSATIQIGLKNTSEKPIDIRTLKFDGKKIKDVCTRFDYAGPVIWYRTNPEVLVPGETGFITIRLRKTLEKAVKLEIAGKELVITPADSDAMRILYVGFNNARDILHVYVSKVTNRRMQLETFLLDEKKIPQKNIEIVNASFKQKNCAYAKIELQEPLPYGKYFILKAVGSTASNIVQLRTRDAVISLGIRGSQIEHYKCAGFSLQYALGGRKRMPNFSNFTALWPVAKDELQIKIAKQLPGREFIHGSAYDEPDAREPQGLPYMQRCGVNVMRWLEPEMAKHRRLDPVHNTALMMDRTYTPLNWYVYGEVADLPVNDCYVPGAHGIDLDIVGKTAEVLLQAIAPRPPQLMLWATINTIYLTRSIMPLENEISVHYALGSGIKGIHYFMDRSTFPHPSTGGYWIGSYEIKPLWRSMARQNALIERLAPLINRSYPWKGVAKSSNPKKLWCSALLAGSDSVVITAINHCYKINWQDKMRQPNTRPVNGETIEVTLPDGFTAKKMYLVAWDKVEEIKLNARRRAIRIPIDNLAGARVFVISSDKNIVSQLQGNPEIIASVMGEQKIVKCLTGNVVASGKWPDHLITIPADTTDFTLDLANPDTLKKATQVIVENGLLEINKDGFPSLLPGAGKTESRADIIFALNLPEKCAEITAKLSGLSHNVGFLSSLEIGMSTDGINYSRKTNFRDKMWNNGKSDKEFVTVIAKNPSKRMFLRIALRDPMLLRPDNYSVSVKAVKFILELSTVPPRPPGPGR